MRTAYVFESAGAKSPEYRLRVPDAVTQFTSTIEHEDTATENDILEGIFAACNRGSNQEDPSFIKTPIPSLSVGDTVTLLRGGEKMVFLCEGSGWTLTALK